MSAQAEVYQQLLEVIYTDEKGNWVKDPASGENIFSSIFFLQFFSKDWTRRAFGSKNPSLVNAMNSQYLCLNFPPPKDPVSGEYN
jgi:hypothetical protein